MGRGGHGQGSEGPHLSCERGRYIVAAEDHRGEAARDYRRRVLAQDGRAAASIVVAVDLWTAERLGGLEIEDEHNCLARGPAGRQLRRLG
jgi:hypothetical protein